MKNIFYNFITLQRFPISKFKKILHGFISQRKKEIFQFSQSDINFVPLELYLRLQQRKSPRYTFPLTSTVTSYNLLKNETVIIYYSIFAIPPSGDLRPLKCLGSMPVCLSIWMDGMQYFHPL